MSIIISTSWTTKLKPIKELRATISKRAGEQKERMNERANRASRKFKRDLFLQTITSLASVVRYSGS